MKLAIVGATGLVGHELLRLLDEAPAAPERLGLFASSASAGAELQLKHMSVKVAGLSDCDFSNYDIAFFSVGDELSREYVPQALTQGCAVVDKSNAFRLAADVPLVVAGVNDDAVTHGSQLVANPNCSTIVAAHALAPLHREFGLRSVWAATYQSVSGAGRDAGAQLLMELAQLSSEGLPRGWTKPELGQYAGNVIPGIGSADDSGFHSEELKLVHETRKILNAPELNVVAHAVRVPVFVGHGLALTVELEEAPGRDEILRVWRESADVMLPERLPSPLSAAVHDQVEVGRLRQEPDQDRVWSFFVVGDNLRLGAALNGWRIMQLMQAAGSVPSM